MIIAEVVAVLLAVGASGAGISALFSWLQKRKERNRSNEVLREQMRKDLSKALSTGDHRRLTDWLTLYADVLPKLLRRTVENRRNELIVEESVGKIDE